LKSIIVATRNLGKLAEIKHRLTPLDYCVSSLNDYDEPIEIVEDRDTFEGNALKKAEAVVARLNRPALSDDSGLEVDALDGGPGVFSARYGGPALDDRGRNDHLLEALRNTPKEARTARFRAAVAYAVPGLEPRVFHGTLEGTIALAQRGECGFGYDPVFIPEGFDKTLGELGGEVKDRISHRAKAMEAFVRALRQS
jgi:XTP/dITP diphosphohydrolase